MTQFTTLPELFLYTTSHFNHIDALSYPQGDKWASFATDEFRTTVSELALGMVHMGIKKGESVGILSPSSPYWVMIDLAILSIGAVTVPIFKKISPESLSHEIKDSGMKTLFLGNPEELEPIKKWGRSLKNVITFGAANDPANFKEILGKGRELLAKKPDFLKESIAKIDPKSIATIIYTSGSTGKPKGVELSHENIISQILASQERYSDIRNGDRALSALPLAHIFERMVVYFYLSRGVPVYFIDDPKELARYAKEVAPSIMTVVPRILEKVFIKIQERVEESHGIKHALASGAIKRAIVHDPDKGASFSDKVYTALVYKKFTAALGGRLRYAICGSAKLDAEVAQFMVNIGINVFEGYGLTEASPVIAANYPDHRKIGTVGMPFPGIEVKISSEGEVYARGPNVMQGYHKLPNETNKVIDADGWLHTGDLGSLDDEGYLTITGRRKELFKKSTGEYVPPIPLEHELSQFPVVDTAVVIADNRTFVTALLFPDLENLAKAKVKFGLEHLSDDDFLDSQELRQELTSRIQAMNLHHHHCEHIEDFRILHHQATIEDGELTPTMKVRRFFIEEKYQNEIEEMYQSVRSWK